MRSMIRHALLASAALTLLAGCAQLSVQTDYNWPTAAAAAAHQLGEVRVYDAQGRLDADNTLQKDRIGRVLYHGICRARCQPVASGRCAGECGSRTARSQPDHRPTPARQRGH